jgi:hypothetical protein
VNLHVKVAAYESACALGAPMATKRNPRVNHKDFRMYVSLHQVPGETCWRFSVGTVPIIPPGITPKHALR